MINSLVPVNWGTQLWQAPAVQVAILGVKNCLKIIIVIVFKNYQMDFTICSVRSNKDVQPANATFQLQVPWELPKLFSPGKSGQELLLITLRCSIPSFTIDSSLQLNRIKICWDQACAEDCLAWTALKALSGSCTLNSTSREKIWPKNHKIKKIIMFLAKDIG